MPLTLPPELDAAFGSLPAARENWKTMPVEVQSDLIAFIKDGWLGHTRRHRSATVARLCAEGLESVLTWQAECAGLSRAGRSTQGAAGITMNDL